MAATSYPVDEMPLPIDNECYTAQEDRRRFGSMICSEGVNSFTDLRVTESAIPAMTVLVSAGGGWQTNDEGTCEGPYEFGTCNPTTVVIDANTSGSTRYDTIWMRTCDAQYSAQGSGGSIYYEPGGATSTDPTTAVVPSDDCSYYLLAIITVANGETTINGTPDNYGLTETDVTDTRSPFEVCHSIGPYVELTAPGITTLVGTSPTKVNLPTTVHIDSAYFTVASSVVTVLQTGLYSMSGWVGLSDANSNGKNVGIFKGGLVNPVVDNQVASVTRLSATPSANYVHLVAGDTIQLAAWAGVSVQTTDSGTTFSRLVIAKIG